MSKDWNKLKTFEGKEPKLTFRVREKIIEITFVVEYCG